MLKPSNKDLLDTLLELDPTLAKTEDASPVLFKQALKGIADLAPTQRQLMDGNDWFIFLERLITLANSKRLSFNQIREILSSHVSGDSVFVTIFKKSINRPDLARTMEEFGRMRCKHITPTDLRRQLRQWTLDKKSFNSSIHTLMMLISTSHPRLNSQQVESRTVTYILEAGKLPEAVSDFIDEHQRSFHNGETPTLSQLQDLLFTFYDTQ